MAGSKTWREYTTDSGQKYSIELDESGSRAMSPWSGLPVTKSRSANHPPMPRGLTPRVLHCWNQADPRQKRAFVVGDPAVILGSQLHIGQIYLTTDNPAQAWIVTGYTGEKMSVPVYYSQIDTGLDDGTASQ